MGAPVVGDMPGLAPSWHPACPPAARLPVRPPHARLSSQRLMGSRATQARPGAASELEGLQACGDLGPKAARSTLTAASRCVQGWGPGHLPDVGTGAGSLREARVLVLPQLGHQRFLAWQVAASPGRRCCRARPGL